MKRNNGFTLTELLVVIAVVGILMGILVPSISRAQVSAKKKRAKMETDTIRLAIIAFERDHLYMPYPSSKGVYVGEDVCLSGDDQGTVIDVLCGSNKLGKVYLEVPQSSRGEGCGKQSDDGNQFLDPWGQRYGIVLDRNKDDHVDAKVSPDGKKLAIRAGVFSCGVPPKGKAQDESFDAKRAIKTW